MTNEASAYSFAYNMAQMGHALGDLVNHAPDEWKDNPIVWDAFLRGAEQGREDAQKRERE